MTPRQVLDRLCELCGIEADYTDIWGRRHRIPTHTKQVLLAAMGLDVSNREAAAQALEELENRSWRRLLPPVAVLVGESALAVTLPATAAGDWGWTLHLEGGGQQQGRFDPARLPLLEERQVGGGDYRRLSLTLGELAPEPGYHRLELAGPEGETAAMELIAAPQVCHQPTALESDGRVWGPAVQLYTLRSRRNWGVGDFGDLKALVEEAAALGADIVGLNPLHALFPHNPEHASPYSPSSRLWLNVLYLDVEQIADFAECAPARDSVAEPEFQARLRALRAAEQVAYEDVAALKFQVLKQLYRHFRDRHLSADSVRGRAFRAFRKQGGESLRGQALYEALQAHFHDRDPAVWGWPLWPKEYQRPDAPAVVAFARRHREQVEFHEYLQWQAELQLAAVGERSQTLGLGVGIYQDLAVSIDGAGAEAWAHQDLYALEARIGAPPDDFSRKGQDWGLPPLIPDRLREVGYGPFIQMLRANMRHSGALRIDHVMGLSRLYWVPAGASPAEGAYVRYPLRDLLGILALESQRNQCLVIGEDLGTVPPDLGEAMGPLGVLSYRLLYFEKQADGAFKAPDQYPRQALVAVTTHDLPTLPGWWAGRDVDLRQELDLYSESRQRLEQIVLRSEDRARLLVALEEQGLLPAGLSPHPVATPEPTPELIRAVYVYLARSPAKLLMIQPEDLFGQVDQVNFPGTTDQYPNWRRKLPLNLEDWPTDPRVQALAEALGAERHPARQSVAPVPGPAPLPEAAGCIPRATYRLQFNKDFPFDRATAIVPYLHELGISHLYASPYLEARPGSLHGYDIIGHDRLNPEIGDRDAFESLHQALSSRSMGQILDVVPNHMGVGSDNHWWLDVLENGPAAAHAEYFDIDWRPFLEELRDKVLLPVLGDQYGAVLDRGELQLGFDPQAGEFNVHYYDHRFPMEPGSYHRVLSHRLERLEARLEEGDPLLAEIQSLMTAFGHLPSYKETDPQRRAERDRDKQILKRHLAELCNGSADLRVFIGENLTEFNGLPGESQSFEALHELLNVQPYRLAYWRVAADDINYRRFFDINDLAGLRMENEGVFRDTHALVLELLATGRLHGLRIDHPDGLYNPVQYFQQLQDAFSGRLLPAAAEPKEAAAALDKPLYVVVEKILESYERLPEHWPVHGTTGYEFANSVAALLVDGSAEEAMDRIYSQFIGKRIDFEALLHGCKKFIIHSALASELNVLANRLRDIAQADRRTRDFTLNSLRAALAEVVACFPVYRTYITAEGLSEEDVRYVDWAVSVARKHSRAADMSIFDFVRKALLTNLAEGQSEETRRQVLGFAMKFQQYTGPVMAKGLEDTCFYRYHRLVALNEVGGDPRRFGSSVAAFHHANQERWRRWPQAMLNTSTHDSKRSEDLRVRLCVLSELPEEWRKRLTRWSRLNAPKRRLVDDQPAPSRNDEYLLYQTLVGVWPLEEPDAAGLEVLRERVEAYMLKAIKEAKVHSSWVTPNAEYEEAIRGFVAALLADPSRNRFLDEFLPFTRRVARLGLFNSLSQTLLKFTVPGVPDIYQGTELWDFSLVDPDNRRPVDYERRRALLDDIQSLPEPRAEAVLDLLRRLEDGRIKLYITWSVLTLRREWPELFRDGDYQPVTVRGERAEQVCAFLRSHGDRRLLVVAPRWYSRLGDDGDWPLGGAWGDTALELPEEGPDRWTEVLSGIESSPQADGALSLARLLSHCPVAMLRA